MVVRSLKSRANPFLGLPSLLPNIEDRNGERKPAFKWFWRGGYALEDYSLGVKGESCFRIFVVYTVIRYMREVRESESVRRTTVSLYESTRPVVFSHNWPRRFRLSCSPVLFCK